MQLSASLRAPLGATHGAIASSCNVASQHRTNASTRCLATDPQCASPLSQLPAALVTCVALGRLRQKGARMQLARRAVLRRELLASFSAASSQKPARATRSLSYVDCPGSESSVPDRRGGFPDQLLHSMDVALIGEHHDQCADHIMEAEFLESFVRAKGNGRVALGLEMVEQPFQPVLDAFNRRDISLYDLYKETQWQSRWGWDFRTYVPIFVAAQACNVPLVALEAPTELRRRVQLDGLGVLTAKERAQYMPESFGFYSELKKPGFTDYARDIVLSGYDAMLHAGVLASTDRAEATPTNFLASQMLREEAIASAAWRHLSKEAAPTTEGKQSLVVLSGYNHVRFQLGLANRLRRYGSGAKRFRVVSDAVPVRSAPHPKSNVVAVLSRGEVFEGMKTKKFMDDGLRAAWMWLPHCRGFVPADVPRGTPWLQSLQSEPFKVDTIILNPAPHESGSTTDKINLTLPLSGVPQKKWPKFADYVWRDIGSQTVV